MKLLCIIVGIISIIVLLYWAFPLALVEGRSMLPTYKNGDILITTRLLKFTPKEGCVYVYKRTDDEGVTKLVVKRLGVYLPVSELCYFEGDNKTESYDSRHYGYIKQKNIVARVIWHIKL